MSGAQPPLRFQHIQNRTAKILANLASFADRRPRLARFLSYIAFISFLCLAIGLLPGLYFGTALTVLICLGIAGSILFIWPRRLTLLAGTASVSVVTLLLDEANQQKASVTAFPITITDLRMLAANPSGLLMAIGAPHWSYLSLYLFPIALAGYLAWWIRARVKAFGPADVAKAALSFGVRLLTVAASLSFLNSSVVSAVSTYLNSHMQELAIWEPEGMVDFPEKVGILGFLSYSQYIEAGDRDHFLAYSPQAAAPPPSDIEASVEKYVRVAILKPEPLPNIVIVHAESTFDPNDVLDLVSPVTNALFYTHPGSPEDPMVQFRGPGLANTIGGGSWISEFEVILGIDSRLFGVAGRFTHASLSQFSRHTFPRYLTERGYEVSTFQPTDGSFYNAEAAYRNYGFQHFFDGRYFDSVSDDLTIMRESLSREVGDPAAPFMKFVILAENHSPHWCDPAKSSAYEDVKLVGKPSDDQACAVREYVRRAHSTERAVALARSYLEAEKSRTGRDYVLAVYGDHQPYSFTGGGSLEHNMGLNFDAFRIDKSKRRTVLQIISSKPDPLKCCGDEAVPLTLLPTLVSSYVAGSAAELYLPESFYQLDHCGSDWIGGLVGTTFYGRDVAHHETRCDKFEALVAAYKASDVLGSADALPLKAAGSEPAPSGPAQEQSGLACLSHSGTVSIEIAASGTRFGDAPRFRVLLDGRRVGEASVARALDNSAHPAKTEDILAARELFDFKASVAGSPKTLSIQFVNDSWAGPGTSGDTDLWLQSVKVGDRLYSSDEFRFMATKDMRGEWADNWFRFATNGTVTVNLSGSPCS
ncbi:MAG: sulfatase-like hydrolase/transferase [Proteobacteria bacterium]|nr:sulfatase-like hydrolase/transferase [Pseudomonadota bacterium]MBS0573208.1 sulfatase-like hydrolase/transferase [Pseudomonadota bacterium]